MKKINLIITLILIFQFCINAQPNFEDLDKKLPLVEAFLKTEMESRNIPGLVYGIFNENALVASGAYGLANVQHQVPVKLETIFKIASITKQFTAAAILILQQDGKLKVSDKLCQYLEECPDQWSDITIHQLLNHTSGLPGQSRKDGTPNLLAEYSGIHQMDPVRVGLAMPFQTKQYQFDLMKTDKLENPAGEAFDYSNVGYFLLGMVIDNISGSYRGFLEERIFKPAGMTATYLKDLENIHFNVASNYTLRNGKLINSRDIYNAEIGSTGDVFSNIPDLQRWDAILNTEKILTHKSKQLLWGIQHAISPEDSLLGELGYGYGWLIIRDSPNKVVWHNGSSGTEFLKAVDDKMSIVILTNLGQGNYDRIKMHGLTEGVANILDLYQ